MNFKEFIKFNEDTKLSVLAEAYASERYSVEITFRTDVKEYLENYAKIMLGYVGASMKQNGYHIKHVYDDKPIRILVTSRNWDDGSWAAVVSYNPEHDGGSFIVSKGFYNKDRRTVSVQSSHKCAGTSAAEVSKDLLNLMHHLKDQKDDTTSREKLSPVLHKRGPKK